MRKIILLSILFVSVFAHAQNKEAQKSFNDIYFFGVDYSKVKVLGSIESPAQFKSAFMEINDLFYNEEKKYNVTKYFRKVVVSNSFSAVINRIGAMSEEEIKSSDPDYEISRSTLEDMIKTLPVKETEGVGLVIIAEKLDKSQLKGYYHIVYFDIKTRDLIDTWRANGKPRGFGVRNFWAGSILKAIQSVKP